MPVLPYSHMPKADFAIVSEATCMEMDIASSSMTYFEVIVPGKGTHTCGRNQILFPQCTMYLPETRLALMPWKKLCPLLKCFIVLNATGV